MKNEKKEFIKAEVEVIRFEKDDVIATSTAEAGAGDGTASGDGANLDDL